MSALQSAVELRAVCLQGRHFTARNRPPVLTADPQHSSSASLHSIQVAHKREKQIFEFHTPHFRFTELLHLAM